MNRHKLLIKNCKKGLDFLGQDEYNTLSTQRNGVLKSQRAGSLKTGLPTFFCRKKKGGPEGFEPSFADDTLNE